MVQKSKISNFSNPAVILFFYSIIISVITFIGAYDPWVWFFELIIGFIGIIILLLTSKLFRFSNLVYILAAIHFTILAIGAHYTYAEMPLFNWLRDTFGLARNYYDRIGHFAQGFFPVIIVREILLRKTKFKQGALFNFFNAFFILGTAAFYEFIEWWTVILFYPTQGTGWLGMQGDVWDAQQDMLMAFTGAILALFFLSKMHDKSIERLSNNTLINK